MARRRLAPLPERDVPRAEHPDDALRSTPGARPETEAFAPIARVAADAAGAAALDEMAETLRRARDEGRMVLELPLDTIAADHLTRDRLPAEDENMASLRDSLRANGQRVPIEVTPLAGALPYGLISGWRRLVALRTLHAETGDPHFATIKALIRRPETAVDAYVSMVEENELRVGLSYYERARVAALATARGVFATEKAALLALFATASRAKRSRIRAFLDLHHALDSSLRFPAHVPERLGLRLVEAVRAGKGPRIAAALAAADPATPQAELATLQAALIPAAPPRPAPSVAVLLPGVTLEQSLRGHTLVLKLHGPGVTPTLAAKARALLDGLDGG